MNTLERRVLINCNIHDAWEFINKPQNLNKITPPQMEFKILSDIPEEMYDGLMIDYRVKVPRFGYLDWTSEIKHVRSHRSFVDEQRVGPYNMWYHFHSIKEMGDQVEFFDQVHYRMPFGVFGKLAHALFVKRDLRNIFDYREESLKRYFEG